MPLRPGVEGGSDGFFEPTRGSAKPPPYEWLAHQLNLPAAKVRSHVGRPRVRSELRRTLGSEEAVDEELHELLRVPTGQ